jgi:hypothetical protein
MTKAERVCELLVQCERDKAMPECFSGTIRYGEAAWEQPLRDAVLLAKEVVREYKETAAAFGVD